MTNAIEKNSPLWKLFVNVRRWSEEECFKERLVWIECVRFHPKCWSYENMKMLEEKCGRVIQVDHVNNGVNCLTFARILISTRANSRIDECIKMEWESGSCEVLVKETRVCDCMELNSENQCENECSDSDDKEVEVPSNAREPVAEPPLDCPKEDNGNDTVYIEENGTVEEVQKDLSKLNEGMENQQERRLCKPLSKARNSSRLMNY